MPTPSRTQQSILIDAVFHTREKHLLEAFRTRLDQLERRQQLALIFYSWRPFLRREPLFLP